MSEPTRVIRGDSAEGLERWLQPDLDEPRRRPEEEEETGPKPPTAEEILAIQQQAYDEGYALGIEEGRAAGKAEYDARLAELEEERKRLEAGGGELRRLMESLARPFEELDERVEQELAELAMAVTRQLVRRELHADPGRVVAAVREAAAALPAASRNIEFHLHPEDAALVREALSLREGEEAWRIVEDPVLTRGGCVVTTETSRIDASVERRLNALVAQVLGDERRDDDRS